MKKENLEGVKNYLMHIYLENQEKWTSQEELLNAVKGLKKTSTTSHDKCIELWFIIDKLNKEDSHLYLINNNSYKIATEEESKVYIENYFKGKIAPALNRYWNFKRKIKKDGEGNVFNENEFYEVFIRSDNAKSI